MTTFGDACAVVAALPPLGTKRCSLAAAAGRTAAERILAPADLVPFARSAMDGFAVRALDTLKAPLSLRIAATVYAEAGGIRHAPQSATAIATGAAIPTGADAVIPVEDVIVRGETIVVLQPVVAGQNVFQPGEDARCGDELVTPGTVIHPALVGLLAAAGISTLETFRLPRTVVLTTGNELVPVDANPAYGQIRDSNGVMIAAALSAFGVASVDVQTVGDERDHVRALIDHALDSADLTVVTGGASVGERDFVKAVCDELGVVFAFREVALRPARPAAFGRRRTAWIAVLPGNPAAAFVALHEFVRPAIAALGGRAVRSLPRVRAVLAAPLHARLGKTLAAYARLRFRDQRFVALPLDNQCSALTRLGADADGFIIVPPDSPDLPAGCLVDVDVVSWEHVFHAESRHDAVDLPLPGELLWQPNVPSI